MEEPKHLHSIKFLEASSIPDEIKKEVGLTDEKGIIKVSLYEQAHELEGLKTTIESAGFDVVNKLLMVKRGNKIFQHVDGEKVFYVEDVNAIKEQYAKEQQLKLIREIEKRCLNPSLKEYLKQTKKNCR